MASGWGNEFMDNLILGVVVCVFVWLMMRRMRLKRMQQTQMQQRASADGEAPEPKTMPRFGKAGTITRAQLDQLKKMDFAPDRGWSEEEASLIIDSVFYLRAAIEDATGEADAPVEIQNNVLALILTDEDLREYIMSWGQNRARRGESDDVPTLRQNEHYDRVVEHIHGLRDDD